MFYPTKPQTSMALCGVLLVGGATYLRAQSNTPAPAKTPQAAAQEFYRLLDIVSVAVRADAGRRYEQDIYTDFDTGSVSRAQWQMIGKNSAPEVGVQLLALLSVQKDLPQYQTRVVGENDGQSVVEVTPDAAKTRQVVTIAEDGGYRVDLKATFGLWNDLSGTKLDLKWYEITGVVTPSLRNDAGFLRAREQERRSSCQTNLKQQALAVIQYAQDYDEKLPPARRWVDVLKPYAGSDEVFRCPTLTANFKSGYGYAFNQYLSQKSRPTVANIANTVLIYETSNPARNWFGDGSGRAYRHEGGSNIAFADGHIKWYKEGAEPGVKFKPMLAPAGY